MKAIQLVEYFLENAPWVNRNDTVDRIIHGDENHKVRHILVTWMCDIASIQEAIRIGADTIITHEATYYNHLHDIELMHKWNESYYKKDISKQKIALFDNHDITVIRNHDVWDRFPNWGIPSAWARFLDLPKKPVMDIEKWQYRFDIEPIMLSDFAQKVAYKAAMLGEAHIQYFGKDEAKVSRIGIGTGCGCALENYIRMDCDLSIVCDDGSCFWSDISWALDVGHSVIRVAHPTSEEPGMISLTEYINKNLKIRADYFRTPDRYKYL